MIAVFVNCAAIVAGSVIGLLFAKKIPQKINDAIQIACGLVSFVIGVQMAFKYQNVVYLALALILGGVVGTALDIDGKILKVGRFLERVFLKKGTEDGASVEPAASSNPSSPTDSRATNAADALANQERAAGSDKAAEFSAGKPQKNFAYAFLNASVLFCVGAMAIVGSFKAGIERDYSIIFLKSVLDGFMAIGFAAAMGVGTAFSALAIFVYQGALTMLSVFIQRYVSEALLAEITGSGGALIVLIGINLMGLKKIKTANYLPAVLFSALFAICEPLVRGTLGL